MNKYIAEAVGTFFLTFIVGVSLAGQFPLPTPLLAALTLMVFVYTTGVISGTHINPAVTIALLTHKKIALFEALIYIIAQGIGAFAASILISEWGLKTASLNQSDAMYIGVAEAIGALLFGYGIYSVASGQVKKSMSGVVIGFSLLLGVGVSALMGANGVLNPAVAFGIGSFNIMYVSGPIVGMVVGMWLRRLLADTKVVHD